VSSSDYYSGKHETELRVEHRIALSRPRVRIQLRGETNDDASRINSSRCAMLGLGRRDTATWSYNYQRVGPSLRPYPFLILW
jgi:hypothetical protein